MRVIINNTYDSICEWTANYIKSKINKSEGTFVLGLPTGSTPIGVYERLVKFYENKEISFKNVVTFNMDEYVGLPSTHEQSYSYFMYKHLFSHIDIDPSNINLLDGCAKNLEEECQKYDEKIKQYGGIDLFLCGMGQDGHLAFNEPGSSLVSRTRVKTLCTDTIVANSRFFKSSESSCKVPTQALTVGIQTIMDAKQIIIMAAGLQKATAIKQCIEGSVSSMYTCTAVQLHKNAIVTCDEEATHELSVKTYKYYKSLQKNIDIHGCSLIDYVGQYIDANDKIMITSPHPDDDVIGLGGTMQLLPNKSNVKIVYMTNGSGSSHGQPHSSIIPDRIKEAVSSINVLGYRYENIINLELPFYYKHDRKIGIEDYEKFTQIIDKEDPQHLFVCADEDPKKTHTKCLEIIKNSKLNKNLKYIWLYMGAWGQFDKSNPSIAKINIPFDNYLSKILSIRLHISQDPPPVPGSDSRDFVTRAIDYNKCSDEPDRYYEYFKIINVNEFQK
jgi:glucosamine-6-phosphate deaminase